MRTDELYCETCQMYVEVPVISNGYEDEIDTGRAWGMDDPSHIEDDHDMSWPGAL